MLFIFRLMAHQSSLCSMHIRHDEADPCLRTRYYPYYDALRNDASSEEFHLRICQ